MALTCQRTTRLSTFVSLNLRLKGLPRTCIESTTEDEEEESMVPPPPTREVFCHAFRFGFVGTAQDQRTLRLVEVVSSAIHLHEATQARFLYVDGWRCVRSSSRVALKSGATRDQTYERYYTLPYLYSSPGFKKSEPPRVDAGALHRVDVWVPLAGCRAQHAHSRCPAGPKPTP